MAKTYKGREIFMETMLNHGLEFIFGNPGTTEMPLMDSLSDYPKIQYILALHESIAVSAAHYYAQATGKTGVVNLHVGPGLGNGMGMLYDAYEAHTPLLLTAGQQDNRMRLREPLLGHDLVAMAEPLTKWSVEAATTDELPHILHRALKIANDDPKGPVFVALPLNVLEGETEIPPMLPSSLYSRISPEGTGIQAAADLLVNAKAPLIIVGDGVADAKAQDELVALSEALGAAVWYEGLHHHINFPTHHPNCRDRMPGEHSSIRKVLSQSDTVLMIGGNFFEEIWYDPGQPFPEGTALIQMESSREKLSHNFALNVGVLGELKESLTALIAEVNRQGGDRLKKSAEGRNAAMAEEKQQDLESQANRAKKLWDNQPIAPARLMAELKDALPANAVIVNESITATTDLKRTISFPKAGDYYGTRGGGIGQALPGGIGAKLAHPDRPVIAISGDGASMYTIQALWTAAHHKIPVLFIINHNRTYRILKLNMNIYRKRFGIGGERPYPHMDLTGPDFNYVGLASGFGVEAREVTDPADLKAAFGEALKAIESGKPFLLDVVTDGTV